ncbi:hypothetical protein M8818_000352 [Zalaria obscura]|uniref:Uncharacterized protein n=1 Tax=Zalaria obscura TaxID=2024903 RepID=A0ACC3SN76_9PEZI
MAHEHPITYSVQHKAQRDSRHRYCLVVPLLYAFVPSAINTFALSWTPQQERATVLAATSEQPTGYYELFARAGHLSVRSPQLFLQDSRNNDLHPERDNPESSRSGLSSSTWLATALVLHMGRHGDITITSTDGTWLHGPVQPFIASLSGILLVGFQESRRSVSSMWLDSAQPNCGTAAESLAPSPISGPGDIRATSYTSSILQSRSYAVHMAR